MPEEIRPDAVYTVAEAAALLRMRRESVRALAESGELRSFVPSGCERGTRVLGSWVIEWMEGGARKPEKPSAPRGDAARAATRGVYQ